LPNYFDILGIPSNSSEGEIKKAFKEKAKLLHPDHNPSPTAHEEFLALYEAMNSALSRLNNPQTYHKATKTEEQRKQEQKEQAIRYAKMKYKAWTKTPEYKELTNVHTIQEFLSSLLILFVIVCLCGMIIGNTGLQNGVLTGILIGLTLDTIIIRQNIFGISLDTSKLFQALLEITSYTSLILLALFILNLIIFFTIGFSTLIPLYFQGIMYIVSLITIHFLAKLTKITQNSFFKKLSISGGIISLFLCLNYFISENPVTKIYPLKEYQEDSLLELKNNELDDYPAIRFFNSGENFSQFKNLHITFETGLFGFEVAKNYHFSNDENHLK
jgi:hypothetical protein